RVGALKLHDDRNKLQETYNRGMKQIDDIPEMGSLSMLDNNETRHIVPLIGEGYEAIHVSGAARVDGQLMNEALINGAIKNGAKLLYDKAPLLHTNEKVTGITVNGETITADT